MLNEQDFRIHIDCGHFSSKVNLYVTQIALQHFVCTCKINVVGVLTFQTSSKVIISTFCFLLITPKSDFLLTGAGTITPKGSMNTANFGKNFSFP